MKRFLNGAYAIEVIAGKLNLSSKDVETKKSLHDSATFVKKINGRGVISAPCQKYNIKRFMGDIKGQRISTKTKTEKTIVIPAQPATYVDEDIFGFMRASSITISKEDYEKLSPEEQGLFTSEKKDKYKQNITKKRRSRFQLSPMINISNSNITNEWNICSTSSDSMPYNSEIYSGMFAGLSNLNITDVSEFKISDISSEFRDYALSEGIEESDIDLSIDEKYNRIEAAIKGLQYLAIEGNQNNHLTDTGLKVVVLGEYCWGNNVFQGCFNQSGIDIEALKETLEENDEFRTSDIYIGVSKRIWNKNFKDLSKKLEEAFANYNYIHIGSVKESFDSYLKFLKDSLK